MKGSTLPRKFTLIMVFAAMCCAYSQAANLKVDCSHQSEDMLPTINAALKELNPKGPNTVTVSGACHENVVIQSFDRLTLVSTSGATINDASSGISSVVDIEDSQVVIVQGFTINGGRNGVVCNAASVCYLTANTVQSSAGQQGVVVSTGSRAFLTSNLIQNNGQRGLTVNHGAQVFSDTDTFRDNADSGIVVTGAYVAAVNSIVQNNGSDGVVAADHATLRFISCTISANTGNGVKLQRASEAQFNAYVGPSTVTGNTGSGVLVRDLSFGFFDQGNNITGNLSGTDVACAPQFPATRGALTQIGGGTTNCVEP